MRTWSWMCVLVIAGCADTDEPEPAAGADPQVDQWVATYAEQALRAERTKTHATGEHPAAEAEMHRCEQALRDRSKTADGMRAVRRACDERMAKYDHARQVAPPGGAMEDADFKMKAVRSLRSELGLDAIDRDR